MTRIYNRKKDQKKRRYLRKNMTKSEILLWAKLKNKQMNGERILRQYGVAQYVLDFYCPHLKLAIEIDGDPHFYKGAKEEDKKRQAYIESLGIRFVRYTNTDVLENLEGVCQDIYSIISKITVAKENAELKKG